MTDDQLKEMIRMNKGVAYNFRERRHDDWTDNYTLYRDKVIVNRLTQRQSVNVPLMKYALKTIMKDIDDPPMLYFNNRDNDTQKEVFYNEYWKEMARLNKLVIKDIVDKKQVLIFGRSFKKLNIHNGMFYFEVIDPQDMLVDRYVDPTSIDTARFICHQHIYRPLSSLSLNPMYDQAAVARLQVFFAERAGLIKAEENMEDAAEKAERMEALGVIDVQNPQLGETYVELNENIIRQYDEKLDRDINLFVVTAEDMEILAKKPLHEVIGKTTDNYWMDHTNFTSWADDTERTDFWSDGVADTIRTPNKILNSWMSQLVENRTLRNFGMHYYNSSIEGFTPQTFEPVAWGWYPVPGDPNTVMKKVEIPDLSESLDEMQFILTIAEKATAATATQQGAFQPQNVTLGEIQLALQNAKERVKSMQSLYTDSWEEFGMKYIKMLEGSGDKIDAVRIFKKGKNTQHIFTKEIAPKDWESQQGYEVEVRDLAEEAGQNTDMLQKLNAARMVMPYNKPLDEIYKQKVLEFAELNANEVKEVMDAEKALPPPVTMTPGNNPGQSTAAPATTPPRGAVGAGGGPAMLPAGA
jgi:hypothetical protein